MKNRKSSLLCIAILFVVTLVTMMPMWTSPYYSSHDTKFHIKNIEMLTEQIKEKPLFPSKVVKDIGNDFGYATDLFYAPLAHTSSSYLNVIFQNPTITLKIVHFIVLWLSGITMYFCSKKISNSNGVGLLSAIIYMLFPYHLSDIYIRDALSETFIFIFLPMIVSSLYSLSQNDRKAFYPLFITGYVGGILSHLNLMAYLTVILLAFLLFKWKFTLKNFKPLILSSIIILLITSPFLVGLIQQKVLGNYRVFIDGVMVQGTWPWALDPFDYLNVMNNYGNQEAKFFLDLTTIILLVITLIKYKKINSKFYNYILVFGIITLILSTKLFPWDILPRYARIIQFPWRMETFVAVSISLLAPLCLKLLSERKMTVSILTIIMILFAQPNLKAASSEIINMNDLPGWYGRGYQQEYLPQATYENKEYFDSRNLDILIEEGSGSVTIQEDKMPKLVFSVETLDKIKVELPRLSYVGYTLKDSHKKSYVLSENKNGFLEATIPSGQYTLDFTGTKIDMIARSISIITLLGCVIVISYKKERGKHGQD